MVSLKDVSIFTTTHSAGDHAPIIHSLQASIGSLLLPALLVAGVRWLAIFLGAWAGCTATGTPPEQRKVFWATMVTQVGLIGCCLID